MDQCPEGFWGKEGASEDFFVALNLPSQLLRWPSLFPKNRPSASVIQGILCSLNCDIFGLFGRRWDGQGGNNSQIFSAQGTSEVQTSGPRILLAPETSP